MTEVVSTKQSSYKMVALKKFPLAQGGSRRVVQEGEEYTIPAELLEFHEKTGRGKVASSPDRKGKR